MERRSWLIMIVFYCKVQPYNYLEETNMCDCNNQDQMDQTAGFEKFLNELYQAKLLIPSGVKGVYGRGYWFEKIVQQFEKYVSKEAKDLNAEVMYFPPVINRAYYSKMDHIHNFPDLLGSVHSFTGNENQHKEMITKFEANEDWTNSLTPTDVMMVPAVCYPLYPASSGTLKAGGRLVDLNGYVFRHEPSIDPARMQLFRMREFVRIGTPDEASAHRDYWLKKGEEILKSLGLDIEVVVANDPFFGRGGRLRKATQREQVLKHEFVVPICNTMGPTAIGSVNYHLDSFGSKFDIRTSNGEIAHSACLGFGLERVTLALLKKHGLNVEQWPTDIKKILDL